MTRTSYFDRISIFEEPEVVAFLNTSSFGCRNCFKQHHSNDLNYLPGSGIKHCLICNLCMTWYSTKPVYCQNGEDYYVCSKKECNKEFLIRYWVKFL